MMAVHAMAAKKQLITTLLIAAHVADARNVLVLGGTQFMGRHMVESLPVVILQSFFYLLK